MIWKTAVVGVLVGVAAIAGSAAAPASAYGQNKKEVPAKGVLGDWQEPGGGVIEVYRCGSEEICLKVVLLAKDAAGALDGHNPDPALRSQAICDLRIGYEFKLADPDHAEGGKLYDPKSGKTYSGSMGADGDKLKLRGYVGVKMFGRTETWTRAGAFERCAK